MSLVLLMPSLAWASQGNLYVLFKVNSVGFLLTDDVPWLLLGFGSLLWG